MDKVAAIEEKLGLCFAKKELLLQAFVHRSFINEQRSVLGDNERLEFLGDSVLGLIVAEFLFRRLPHHPEGQLTQIRSKLVDRDFCAQALRQLELEGELITGRGETVPTVSMLADVFEALVGAIYLDGGLQAAQEFLVGRFAEKFEQVIDRPPRNYKAELQDYAQRKLRQVPVYTLLEETGPEHAKEFRVAVWVADKELGVGVGASKKQAEQQAAYAALVQLGEVV